MKKKRLTDVILILIFFVGLSILMYPSVSNHINLNNASRSITEYDSTVHNIMEEEISKIYSKAERYNRKIAENTSAFYNPSIVEGYNDTLNITGTGIMGYIYIPSIDVELPIYHGTDSSVLQIGIGHIEGSSLPVGGKSTHCILSGHRGLPSARLFTDLDKLQEGDKFSITVLDKTIEYEVDSILVVLPTETDALLIEKDMDYCTLMTCTPYGINTHRLLVRGKRVESFNAKPGIFIPNEAFLVDSYIIMGFALIPVLAVILITMLIHIIKPKLIKKKAEKGDNENAED